MTKAEKKYLSDVAEIGCLICRRPAEIHHVRAGMGKGQRSQHIGGVIPLCHEHHRTGGHGVAFHAGKRTWQERFGSEKKLLEQVREKIKCTT